MKARISPAWIVTTVLLVLATSTSAYAAGLAANSVGTKHLKNNAVVSTKVKDGTLRRTDFRPGTLLRGATGPAGPAGPKGGPGPAGPPGPQGEPGTTTGYIFATPNASGFIFESGGTGDGAVITHPATGIWCISDPDFVVEDAAYVATVVAAHTHPRTATVNNGVYSDPPGCHASQADLVVHTYDLAGAPADAAFVIAPVF
ncbi:hypothetical protein [Nocardioides speluncae]|uniref:hypothetical protein n=1 Tax=Nocardioides speluncae TaxID=2670337 RepID=UPI000D693DF3|nr:hypothetical protein [Nocardioides speluncae]